MKYIDLILMTITLVIAVIFFIVVEALAFGFRITLPFWIGLLGGGPK